MAAPASTRGSWIAAKETERVNISSLTTSDPKFKKYVQAVEKCLTTFDNVHEWADFIAFLTKLLKTFQSYMQFKEIPKKLIVAKRLAQCLNPALPTGVHQRALDVYAHLLAVLGPDGLKRDLNIWSSGLFPFFEYAATSVKPTLLNLYDTHYLPLGTGLRPVMKAFIVALLPGLEEETGEFFDKVLSILDRLSETVSPAFFFQNVWLILLTSTTTRGPALNYLSRRLPNLGNAEDLTVVVGRDLGLMVRAFAAALEDEHLLVRRGILDLLVQSLRLDGYAIKHAQPDDRSILMKSAVNVVLRRDLSLNRRLYTWLLGPGENSDVQIAYLREHSLHLLCNTLRDEMFAPRTVTSGSRPYKIFLSLLDKWEIGSLLTEVLILDAFKAARTTLDDESTEAPSDVVLAVNSLYEAIEPSQLWKQLFLSLRAESLNGDESPEVLDSIRFIIKTFRVQDEETQKIHMPLFFLATIDMIRIAFSNRSGKKELIFVRSTLELLSEILPLIHTTALMQWQELEMSHSTIPRTPYSRALQFYDIPETDEISTHNQPIDDSTPFTQTFGALITISTFSADDISSATGHHAPESLMIALSLLTTLVRRVAAKHPTEHIVQWSPSSWLGTMLRLVNDTIPFELFDEVTRLCITLSESSFLKPRLVINDRKVISALLGVLLNFLRPEHVPYHVRAVHWVWTLQDCTKQYHVEALISQSLSKSSTKYDYQAFESFGVLWRLTDDSILPGFRLKIPMLLVLDTLKSENPGLRRTGETWMRSSLKSYLRVLDPILWDLVNPQISRVSSHSIYHSRSVRGYEYDRPFDQHQIHYVLESLLSVVRFGGQGFAKVARITPLKRSQHPSLFSSAEAANVAYDSSSYLDVLLEILLRLLQSEPKAQLVPTMSAGNLRIQSVVIDILQAIVARGETDPATLDTMEAAIISRLYVAVHTDRLDLQNKLLHVLHSVIFASGTSIQISRRQSSRGSDNGLGMEEGVQIVKQPPTTNSIGQINPLLVQTLVDGLSKSSNRPVLQHWIDFVLMTVSQFQRSLSHLIIPLSECICRQLRNALTDVQRVLAYKDKRKAITSTTTDAEFIMMLNALERLILLSLSKTAEDSTIEDESGSSEKGPTESTSGLLGYVSNVFGAESSLSIPGEQLSSRLPGYRLLHEGIHVLHSTWLVTSREPRNTSSAIQDSVHLIFGRVQNRCQKVLERIFKTQTSEVMESLIECWRYDIDPHTEDHQKADTFAIIDSLAPNAQTVVQMLCESISLRTVLTFDRGKKMIPNPNLSDAAVFSFLEQYLGRLEGPIATQVWTPFIALAKEITSNVHGYKFQVFPMLRCMTVLSEKLTKTTMLEDRRIRKELQDTYIKLADTCILIAGRSFDQGTWIRRSTKDNIAVSGRASPMPSEIAADEKSTIHATDDGVKAWGADLIEQINDYLTDSCLPNLRKFLVDNDKVVGICSNIAYYIINPAMKAKSSKSLDVEETVLDIVARMTKIPASTKVWRPIVVEAFNDNRFFNSSPQASLKWRPLIRSLMDADKQSFVDLIAKIAAAPATNIFTNRETETLLRSLNLRRLSYVLFAGDKNHFLVQLPAIQERLVDMLRTNVTTPIIHSEVFLCMRVLLCRLSPHNLTSFWPVILTELFRVFEQIITTPPADGSDDLILILSACKLLDLLVVLQTEEFQVHQWMFVTDTVDAVYRPDNWAPESIMDQLAEIVGEMPDTEPHAGSNGTHSTDLDPMPASGVFMTSALRRPLLSTVRSVDSIKDLITFFGHISMSSYESTYAGGLVDWDTVEKGLIEEIFDGRD